MAANAGTHQVGGCTALYGGEEVPLEPTTAAAGSCVCLLTSTQAADAGSQLHVAGGCPDLLLSLMRVPMLCFVSLASCSVLLRMHCDE